MKESMLFILQLGVYILRMSIEEAINGATANSAYAIERHKDVGSLESGKKMDLILCKAANYPTLVYHLGINPIRHIIKNGRLVVKDGEIVKGNS